MVYGWLMVGTLLGDGWHNVGLWLVIVGAMLGDSWRLVGFWLAVRPEANVCKHQPTVCKTLVWRFVRLQTVV